MEEKIKISLPKTLLELLKKDCEDFKILKDDNKTNMNLFINTLIANFYEEFSAHEEQLHEDIKDVLSNLPERYKDDLFHNIIKLFAKKSENEVNKKETTTLSFKPTKLSMKAVIYIEQILLKSESLSSFYRRMFLSYASKTKNEREKIIYKEQYEYLTKAIKKNLQVCLTLNNSNIMTNMTVYAIHSAKDELFNYVLLYGNKQNFTIRLASIETVSLLTQKANIPNKNATLFDRQIECAVQYPMYNTDDEPIKVQLTEKGKYLFQKIYLYRPTPINIEGDIYTFNCSANQLLYYFERFGENALILSPKKLGIFMRNYYHYALKKYKSVYLKN